jgi:hypothetical protein
VASTFARASVVHEIAMATLAISAEGQITLDGDLLKHLGMRPGCKDGFGLLKRKDGPSLSIEEMTAIGPPTP